MLSVERARQTILQAVQPKATEVIPFAESLARVLAADIIADAPLPPFSQSAMDGFAVRVLDTTDATPDRPVSTATANSMGGELNGHWLEQW